MRKIVQIIIDNKNHIVALCNDGTLWIKDAGWFQIHTDEICLDSDDEE